MSGESSFAKRARQTVSLRPSTSPRAPMCGESARIWFRSSVGGRFQSSSRSSGVRRSAYVAPSSGWGRKSGELGEHLLEQLGRELTRALVDDACVVLDADQKGALGGDRAGVELRRRPVNRDSRLVVPGHDRPLDRRRAAPAREQRRMDVEPARAVEEALGNERAVGGHDHRVRRLERERLVQALGLADRDPEPVAPSPWPAARRPAALGPAVGRGG